MKSITACFSRDREHGESIFSLSHAQLERTSVHVTEVLLTCCKQKMINIAAPAFCNDDDEDATDS